MYLKQQIDLLALTRDTMCHHCLLQEKVAWISLPKTQNLKNLCGQGNINEYKFTNTPRQFQNN